MMPFVLALLLWFALSIPATLVIARLLGAPSPRRAPARRRVADAGHRLHTSSRS